MFTLPTCTLVLIDAHTHTTHRTLMWLIQLIERHFHSRKGAKWIQGETQRTTEHKHVNLVICRSDSKRNRHTHCETSISIIINHQPFAKNQMSCFILQVRYKDVLFFTISEILLI